MFDWSYAREILPVLLVAFRVTLRVTLAGTALALSLGLVWALVRRSRLKWLSMPIGAVVQFIRTTPLLVQLYVLFYMAPEAGLTLSPEVTGILALGIHFSTYTAEVYRAGIEAVPRQQWEAAAALNLGEARTLFAVILPQAIRPVLPALGNYAVAMFKETPLLSAITVVEVLQTARLLGSERFRYLEPYTVVGLLFLVATLVASYGVKRLEARLRLPGEQSSA